MLHTVVKAITRTKTAAADATTGTINFLFSLHEADKQRFRFPSTLFISIDGMLELEYQYLIPIDYSMR